MFSPTGSGKFARFEQFEALAAPSLLYENTVHSYWSHFTDFAPMHNPTAGGRSAAN